MVKKHVPKTDKATQQVKKAVTCETLERIVQVDEEISDLVNQRYQTTQDFDKKIEAAKARRSAIIEAGLPQPIWIWDIRITIQQEERHFQEAPTGTELVYVGKKISNLDAIKETWEIAGCSIPYMGDAHNKGITYYRKNGVLLHCHGGTIYLHGRGSHPIVTDKEWAQIKKGNIPSDLAGPLIPEGRY